MGTLFTADRIWDGAAPEPLEDAGLIVGDDGRIEALGPLSELKTRGLPEVSGPGTLMPGLIDAHVHLTLSGGLDPRSEILAASPEERQRQAVEAAEAHLDAGVTTVRDLGAPGGEAIRLAREIAAGLRRGPEVIPAGHLLCITGGHGDFVGRAVSEAEGFWEAGRREIEAGARWLKLAVTGGMMTPGVDPGKQQLPDRDLHAALAIATERGVRVAAHAQGAGGVLAALEAGVATIEHGIWLDEACLDAFERKGASLVPTFNASRGILAGRGRGVPDFVVEKMARAVDDHRKSFAAALARGVRIVAGTDAGTPLNRHGDLAAELEAMIEAGLPPHAALVSCTSGAAEGLGLGDRGLLAPGRRADLTRVDGDPLTEPGCLRRVVGVHREGRSL
ncbi:MAG: amidohydrolase family protein [Deltaproteobacteria bacterium]|nr:amidohydrolase family protein [Deltaproteobacteria bacterium]